LASAVRIEHKIENNSRQFIIQTADGCSLGAWHLMPPGSKTDTNEKRSFENDLKTAKRIFIYCHGNLGDRGLPHRVHLARLLMDKGASVISMDYRGFGESSCRPSESGLVQDVQAAMKYLKDAGATMSGVYLIGHSLGTGPVLQAIQPTAIPSDKLGGVILLAPYSSMRDAVASAPISNVLFPFFRFHKLRGRCFLM
jgi:abhydrolase domain-containing protein 12